MEAAFVKLRCWLFVARISALRISQKLSIVAAPVAAHPGSFVPDAIAGVRCETKIPFSWERGLFDFYQRLFVFYQAEWRCRLEKLFEGLPPASA